MLHWPARMAAVGQQHAIRCEHSCITFFVWLKVPKFCSRCTMLLSKGCAEAVPSGRSHLQQLNLLLATRLNTLFAMQLSTLITT